MVDDLNYNIDAIAVELKRLSMMTLAEVITGVKKLKGEK